MLKESPHDLQIYCASIEHAESAASKASDAESSTMASIRHALLQLGGGFQHHHLALARQGPVAAVEFGSNKDKQKMGARFALALAHWSTPAHTS